MLLAGAIVLSETGRLSRIVGIYGVYAHNASFLSSAFFGSLAEHAATFALALAVLPAVIAAGWLLANLVRPAAGRELHAFACIGSLTMAVVSVLIIIFPSLASLGITYMLPMGFYEFGLGFWLLIKGIRAPIT